MQLELLLQVSNHLPGSAKVLWSDEHIIHIGKNDDPDSISLVDPDRVVWLDSFNWEIAERSPASYTVACQLAWDYR